MGLCGQQKIAVIFILILQSLDPLPMHGPELGVQADDVEAPGVEQESKQEVLENKSVRTENALLMFRCRTSSFSLEPLPKCVPLVSDIRW